jgi:hypothetical protein
MKEARTPNSRPGFSHRIPSMLAAVAIIAGGASQAHAQSGATNQIAIMLGATQLKYASTYRPGTNTSMDASALRQGQLALSSTSANYLTNAYVVSPGKTNPTVVPNPQSGTFRSQYLAAVQRALTNPTTRTITNVNVTTYNPSTKKYATNPVSGLLSPTNTTPTQILNVVVAQMPNFAPAIISNTVAATMAGTTNTNGIFIPVWGAVPNYTNSATNIPAKNAFNSVTASNQLVNAGNAAAAALTAASKAYTNGTVNWQGYPKTGNPASNTVYLPNFGTNALGQAGLTNNQRPNQLGLADTASAVAANAINGLGNFNTNATGLYGKSSNNVRSMTQNLIKAASAFQTNSTVAITGVPRYTNAGSLGAASFGIVTQVAGRTNSSWGTQAAPDSFTTLLNGVVRGAVTAVGKTSPNLGAIARGVAQAFTATYLQTTFNAKGTFWNMTNFLGTNSVQILASFTAAGVSTNLVSTNITYGITNAWSLFNRTNGVWTLSGNTMAGAKGINLQLGTNALLIGVGRPVTDTTGL